MNDPELLFDGILYIETEGVLKLVGELDEEVVPAELLLLLFLMLIEVATPFPPTEVIDAEDEPVETHVPSITTGFLPTTIVVVASFDKFECRW